MRTDLWHVSDQPWLDMWARWDSGFYLRIATEGYIHTANDLSHLAFFPLYPLLLRVISLGAGDWAVVTAIGVLISNVATLTAFYLLYRLTLLDEDRATGQRTIWIFAFFPTSFFLSVVYTEGLFLMLTVAAFYACQATMVVGSWSIGWV